MANQTNSLAHTKWVCKYHIVFTPKYRRKAIYGQYRDDLRDIIKTLCTYKGVEIIEGHMMIARGVFAKRASHQECRKRAGLPVRRELRTGQPDGSVRGAWVALNAGGSV